MTDTHILGPDETQFVDNNGLLAAAVAAINAERPAPDAVVGTGDLTNWSKPAQFEALAALVAPLAAPFLPLVGNHDGRQAMRDAFPDVPWADAEHASWVTTIEGVTIVGLDSSDPGHHGAAFDDERAVWLDGALAGAGEGPVVLALHHPPFTTGIRWMDAFGFAGLDAFRSIVADNAHRLSRIVCGHIHRHVVTTVAGVTASICPATCHHVDLDLAPDSTPTLIRDPRAYQLHLVTEEGVVTHTRYFDSGEQAFTPDWD